MKRNLLFSMTLLLTLSLAMPTLAGLKRTGGNSHQQAKEYEKKKIEGIRDAVDALRDSLALQPQKVQDAMQSLLRQVNAEAEQFIAGIQAYADARDDYYFNAKDRDKEQNDEARLELYEKSRQMRVEQQEYYEATAAYLRGLHKARRSVRSGQ